MMSNEMLNGINNQIKMEMNASYFYYSQSAYFKKMTLNGFAQWCQVQAQEELQHALRFYTHLLERHEKVALQTIPKPIKTWESPLASFKQALKWEENVTKAIHTLMDIAESDADHSTVPMLNWFINEQVEEESRAQEMIDKLTAIGKSPGGLFMLDASLKNTVATSEK